MWEGNAYTGVGSADLCRPAHHLRRAYSDLPFHIPNDLGFAADEIVGSEDDPYSSFEDVDGPVAGDGRRAPVEKGEVSRFPDVAVHRHCSSADGLASGGDGVFGEIAEVTKAMVADKMAELALIDPKRAKRLVRLVCCSSHFFFFGNFYGFNLFAL